MSDDASPPLLDETIAAYYAHAPEEIRLGRGAAQLEFARTCEILDRVAPPAPAVVLDVGGGSGPYACRLAELGYEVHLLDPVSRLVDEARRASARLRRPMASCRVGDARRLDQPDRSADLVLMLGPLYHLPEAHDRARALAEAHRVLRAGGLLVAAAISRFASLFDGLARDLLGDADFALIVEQDLATGRHRNPTPRQDYFTTAYFHHPAELEAELSAAGFRVEGLYGVEGAAWMLSDFDRRWADPAGRERLLRSARAIESEPALLGVSAHLLGIGRRT
ncbi:MAG TPA: class I SAM-dependent methyltransferase [Gemmatimonadales bacterium]